MAGPCLASRLAADRKAIAVGIAWCDWCKLGLHQSTGSETVQQLADDRSGMVRSNPLNVVQNGVNSCWPHRREISTADALRRSNITVSWIRARWIGSRDRIKSTFRCVGRPWRHPQRAWPGKYLPLGRAGGRLANAPCSSASATSNSSGSDIK